MKSSNTPHLDPLPSSDEGRGNSVAVVKPTSIWATERGRIFPLPFRRGEDQGEGLSQWAFVSLIQWPWSRGEGWERSPSWHQKKAVGCTTPHPQSLSPLRGEGSPGRCDRERLRGLRKLSQIGLQRPGTSNIQPRTLNIEVSSLRSMFDVCRFPLCLGASVVRLPF